MLPLKCFNYGNIGHYASKCRYPKQEDSDDEEPCSHKKDQNNKTIYKKKIKNKKKNFYSMNDSCSNDLSEDEEA